MVRSFGMSVVTSVNLQLGRLAPHVSGPHLGRRYRSPSDQFHRKSAGSPGWKKIMQLLDDRPWIPSLAMIKPYKSLHTIVSCWLLSLPSISNHLKSSFMSSGCWYISINVNLHERRLQPRAGKHWKTKVPKLGVDGGQQWLAARLIHGGEGYCRLLVLPVKRAS